MHKLILSVCLFTFFGTLTAQRGTGTTDFMLRVNYGQTFRLDREVNGDLAEFALDTRRLITPRFALVVSVGVNQQIHEDLSGRGDQIDIEPFVNGLVVGPRLSNVMHYRIRQRHAFVGLGVQRDFGRLNLGGLLRGERRLGTNYEVTRRSFDTDGIRPDVLTHHEVEDGEEFTSEGRIFVMEATAATLFRLQLSANYALGARWEVGMDYLGMLSGLNFERRLVRFCENCPEETGVVEDRRKGRISSFRLGLRYRL